MRLFLAVFLPFWSKAPACYCLMEERDLHITPISLSPSPLSCARCSTPWPLPGPSFSDKLLLSLGGLTPGEALLPAGVGPLFLPTPFPAPPGSHSVLHKVPTALRTLHVGTTLISSLPRDPLQGRKH